MTHLSSGNKRARRSLEAASPSYSGSRGPVAGSHSILFLRAVPTLPGRMFALSRRHYPQTSAAATSPGARGRRRTCGGATSGKDCGDCGARQAELSARIFCSEPLAARRAMLPAGLFFAFSPCAVWVGSLFTQMMLLLHVAHRGSRSLDPLAN